MTRSQPLADRLRPHSLDTFIGQKHLVGAGKPLRLMAESGNLRSMLFWGAPGVGKTTLGRILAQAANRPYYELSAVSAGKKELVEIIETIQRASTPRQPDLFSALEPKSNAAKSAVLFLDEIHRFNKAQQDFLLPYVENGTLTLIGATTENPSFEVISALLSRCQVFVLNPLTAGDLVQIIAQGAAALGATLTPEAADFLAGYANGDARKLLNVLESAVELYGTVITLETLKAALQSKLVRYDKQAEEHYDTISAYIKSMRASDPDAALYYLARMIAGGEDGIFIARRMVIFASEDVGMADPNALLVASAVFRAVETVGLPEAGINLAHGTVYMATAPKHRAAYDGLYAALAEVESTGNLAIPLFLRNAPTRLMQELGYARSQTDGESRLPEGVQARKFYNP